MSTISVLFTCSRECVCVCVTYANCSKFTFRCSAGIRHFNCYRRENAFFLLHSAIVRCILSISFAASKSYSSGCFVRASILNNGKCCWLFFEISAGILFSLAINFSHTHVAHKRRDIFCGRRPRLSHGKCGIRSMTIVLICMDFLLANDIFVVVSARNNVCMRCISQLSAQLAANKLCGQLHVACGRTRFQHLTQTHYLPYATAVVVHCYAERDNSVAQRILFQFEFLFE